jgi:hypothetical protein
MGSESEDMFLFFGDTSSFEQERCDPKVSTTRAIRLKTPTKSLVGHSRLNLLIPTPSEREGIKIMTS